MSSRDTQRSRVYAAEQFVRTLFDRAAQHSSRAIDFFGRELLAYCDGSLDETAREHLNRMLAGQRRMVHIIDAMMALCRVSTDGLAIDLSAVLGTLIWP